MTSLVFHDFTFPIFAPVSICHQMSTTLLLKNDVIYMNGPNVVRGNFKFVRYILIIHCIT